MYNVVAKLSFSTVIFLMTELVAVRDILFKLVVVSVLRTSLAGLISFISFVYQHGIKEGVHLCGFATCNM